MLEKAQCLVNIKKKKKTTNPSCEEDAFYPKFSIWKGTSFLEAVFKHEMQGDWGQPVRLYQRKSHLTNLTIFSY